MTNKGRPRAVIDTNVLTSGLLSRSSAPFHLISAWRAGRFIGVLSPPLRQEYENVLRRPRLAAQFKLTPSEIRSVLTAIDGTSDQCPSIGSSVIPLRDPKDEMVIATAVEGNADFVVTGDRDLLVVAGDSRLGSIKIVTVTEFLAELSLE